MPKLSSRDEAAKKLAILALLSQHGEIEDKSVGVPRRILALLKLDDSRPNLLAFSKALRTIEAEGHGRNLKPGKMVTSYRLMPGALSDDELKIIEATQGRLRGEFGASQDRVLESWMTQERKRLVNLDKLYGNCRQLQAALLEAFQNSSHKTANGRFATLAPKAVAREHWITGRSYRTTMYYLRKLGCITQHGFSYDDDMSRDWWRVRDIRIDRDRLEALVYSPEAYEHHLAALELIRNQRADKALSAIPAASYLEAMLAVTAKLEQDKSQLTALLENTQQRHAAEVRQLQARIHALEAVVTASGTDATLQKVNEMLARHGAAVC